MTLFWILVGLVVLLVCLLNDKVAEFDYEKRIRKAAEEFGRRLK